MSMNTTDLQNVAGTAAEWVGHAALYGTLLAAVTWLLLRSALRRRSLVLHSALWIVVLIKFLVPVGPSFSWSLATATQRIAKAWHAPTVATTTPPTPSAAGGLWGQMDMVDVSAASAAPTAAAPARAWPIAAILGAIYLSALFIIVALRLTTYAIFVNRCRKLPDADAPTLALVAEVCHRLSVRRLPRVRLSDDAPAPFVFGALHPTLVLSRRHLVRPDELEAVILHEIAHLRRGDLFVRYVQWLAGTVFYFWPVVAWVNRRIDLAREHACDEWALRHGRLSAAEYARCLLRALHPATASCLCHGFAVAKRPVRFRPSLTAYVKGLPTYAPAAMAANLMTVERRIEMILETPTHRNFRGSLGVPAALLIAAWAGFALTGAAVAQSAQQSEKKEAEKDVIIVTHDEDTPGDVQAGGKRRMFVHKLGDGHEARVFASRHMSEKDLQEFLAAHPTADANADGTLAQVEHDAFLVALALGDSAAVATQFPHADRNKDGRLDEGEAAQLVTGGGMFMKKIKMLHGAMAGGEAREVRRARVRQTVVNGKRGQGGAPIHLALAGGPDASKWLVENITAQPTVRDVAKCIKVVEEAPLVAFYDMHPEADTDTDGKVSAAERDAFMSNQTARARSSLLKKYPAADTNGDGTLSEEEMIGFAKANGAMTLHETGEAGDVIMFRANAEGAKDGDGETVEFEVKVIKEEKAADGGN